MTIGQYQERFNNKVVKNYQIGDTVGYNYSYKLESPYEAKHTVVDLLKDLTENEGSHKLEALIIGVWQDAWEADASKIVGYLVENCAKFPVLKHVFFGDMTYEDCEISWINQTSYEQFFKAYPNLETFCVRGGQGLEFGKISLPKLKKLVIETGGLDKSVMTSLIDAKASFESLEHLEIWLGTDDYGANIEAEQVATLIAGEGFPQLEYLGLKNSDMQDSIAELLQGQSILSRIETLDLSMGTLTDKGAKALLANDGLLQLKHLNCRHHFVSDALIAQLKEKFAAQQINLDGQEEMEEDWLYVEVGE